MAVFGGHIEIAQILLVYGADPNIIDGSGHTPLVPAIENCDAPMVKMLLEMRADPNMYDEDMVGRSPLELAIERDLPHIVDLLLEQGAGAA